MKTIQFICFLIIALSSSAQDRAAIKLATLARIPRERQVALIRNAITSEDSSSAISLKRQAYYTALRRLAESLKNEYYWHNEFPTDVFAGIDQRAEALVAVHYPATPTTGASYVDELRDSYRNAMAEELVVSMARQICTRTKESDVQIVGQPLMMDFRQWEKNWKSAGDIKGAPTPKATLGGDIGKQEGAAFEQHATRSKRNRTGPRQ